MPIPALKTSLILRMSCPVRGASRGVTEVGQSESWPEGQPEGRCGARGCASQAWTRGALGNRPSPLSRVCLNWLGGAGEGWAKACLDGELRFAPVPEVTVPGSKKSLRRSVRKALLLLPRRVVRRSVSPQKGRKLKAQLARRREDESAWLFEIRIGKIFARCATNTPPSSSRKRDPYTPSAVRRKVSATCGNNSPNNNHRWLWVPAFAGTTRME
jgi:hypothetical protein